MKINLRILTAALLLMLPNFLICAEIGFALNDKNKGNTK